MDRLGQRAGHVGQPACLGKRDYFGRQQQNLKGGLWRFDWGHLMLNLLGHILTSDVRGNP
jgi:hypothetical protein